MMTEAEANKKWCPYANVYVPYQGTGAAGNRGLSESRDTQGRKDQALCIASSCMAWRWEYRSPEEAGRASKSPITGYCGAFGVVGSPKQQEAK